MLADLLLVRQPGFAASAGEPALSVPAKLVFVLDLALL
jgi:hypothetical protein